jgi:hypothetical protein
VYGHRHASRSGEADEGTAGFGQKGHKAWIGQVFAPPHFSFGRIECGEEDRRQKASISGLIRSQVKRGDARRVTGRGGPEDGP